jgi:hypothetical protein
VSINDTKIARNNFCDWLDQFQYHFKEEGGVNYFFYFKAKDVDREGFLGNGKNSGD